MQSINMRAAILSVVIFIVIVAIWEFTNQAPDATTATTEYQRLVGGSTPHASITVGGILKKSLSW